MYMYLVEKIIWECGHHNIAVHMYNGVVITFYSYIYCLFSGPEQAAQGGCEEEDGRILETC